MNLNKSETYNHLSKLNVQNSNSMNSIPKIMKNFYDSSTIPETIQSSSGFTKYKQMSQK